MLSQTYVQKQITNVLTEYKKIEPATMASLSIDEVLNMEVPEQKWLVNNLIPAGALTVVSAPPNSFKTLSMTHLAICVANDKPLFDQFTTNKSGVLIVDEENGWRLVKQQLTMLGAEEGLPIRIRSRHNFKLNDENIGIIMLDCKTYGLDTVIFDSLIDMHDANENDSVEMGRVMTYFKQLIAAGITVIVLHHDRKPGVNSHGGSAEVRGSSNIYAQADAHISLKRDGDKLKITPTKLRYANPLKPFDVIVKYDDTSFEFEYLGNTKQEQKNKLIWDAIIDLLNENELLYKKEIQEKLIAQGVPINDKKLKGVLDAMHEAKVVEPMKGIGNVQNFTLTS